jgi:multidrug resistance efflux pump
MPVPFDRTLRALSADGLATGKVSYWAGSLLLVAWLAWGLFGEVGVWADAPARLEVEARARNLTAPVSGKIARFGVELGATVAAGDLLVELDAEDLQIRLDEAQGREEALTLRITAVEQAILAEEAAIEAAVGVAEAGQREARARAESARAAANAAAQAAERAESLYTAGGVSAEERGDRSAHSLALSAVARAERAAARRRGAEGVLDEQERLVEVEALRALLAELEGERAGASAMRAELERQLLDRWLVAPVAGRIAERPPYRNGDRVQAGEVLLTVLPEGDLRVVADFPAERLGRVGAGQDARIAFDGFPWAEWGHAHAEVISVAELPRAAGLRVELRLKEDETEIPLAPGLQGTVSVCLERTSPLRLLARSAGAWTRP